MANPFVSQKQVLVLDLPAWGVLAAGTLWMVRLRLMGSHQHQHHSIIKIASLVACLARLICGFHSSQGFPECVYVSFLFKVAIVCQWQSENNCAAIWTKGHNIPGAQKESYRSEHEDSSTSGHVWSLMLGLAPFLFIPFEPGWAKQVSPTRPWLP